MTKRPSPSKRHRDPLPARANRCRKDDDSELEPLLSPLESAIEDERSRLGRARAVLGCLRVALLYADEDGDDCDVGDFADAAEVARGLVGETVQRLDSVKIGPLMKNLRIREYAERYLCRSFESDR